MLKRGINTFLRSKPTPDSLIAISDFVADTLEQAYNIRPSNVIPVGVNPDRFKQSNRRGIDILGAGSLIPLKQYAIFLNVVELLLTDFPSLSAVICGDGPEIKKLETIIKNKRLENNVKLARRCSHSEVLRYMERSKIFMHPSNYEGFSTVCLEALYAGNKVVSFIKPMHFDIENWAIVHSEAEMAEAIKKALISKIGYNSILPYHVNDSAKRMLELFDY